MQEEIKNKEAKIESAPFLGGTILRLSNLTDEEVRRLVNSSTSPGTTIWYDMTSGGFTPSLVLWRIDFTKDHPWYKLTLTPNATKAELVREELGVEISEQEELEPVLDVLHEPTGRVFKISNWDGFLATASEDQIRAVKEYLDSVYPFND